MRMLIHALCIYFFLTIVNRVAFRQTLELCCDTLDLIHIWLIAVRRALE